MRQTNRRKQQAWAKVATLFFAALLLASCSMMKEDRSDCPDCRNPLHIKVRYDYNIQRANMFADHVEQATVFVVDPATGTIIDTQTASNSATSQPLRDLSFAFNFEGLAPGIYRLYATGRSAAEAAYKTTTPDIAQLIESLSFTIPTDANGQVPAQRLDTIWNTLKPIDVVIPEKEPTEATIGLMRLTNDLNVMVFRRDHPADNGHERYEVIVTDNHPTLDYDNAPVSERLRVGASAGILLMRLSWSVMLIMTSRSQDSSNMRMPVRTHVLSFATVRRVTKLLTSTSATILLWHAMPTRFRTMAFRNTSIANTTTVWTSASRAKAKRKLGSTLLSVSMSSLGH